MKSIFLSLGSNIAPEKNIPACIKKLCEVFDVQKISSIFETDPVGPSGNSKFWNLVVEIKTDLSKDDLQRVLREIEAGLGRERDISNKFIPRTIDIDILPQPDYQKLAFIMIPLAEISPDTEDAQSQMTFKKLAENLEEEGRNFKQIKAPVFYS